VAHPRDALDTAIWNALQADATTRPYQIFNTTPPGDDELAFDNDKRMLPYIIFNQYSGGDWSTFGQRGWEIHYLVKVVSESPYPQEAAQLMATVDTALHGVALTVSGYNHIDFAYESDISYGETSRGKTYTHVGSIYRIWETAA